MARLIRVPYLASLVVVSDAGEIDDLLTHPSLVRSFERKGPLANRLLVRGIDRQFRHRGEVLPAFKPEDDAVRREGQARLFERLDRFAAARAWPVAPVAQMARYVATGQERRDAEAALAYAVAAPFMGPAPDSTHDDAYLPRGRHLWRLHRRVARARRPFSLGGLLLRLIGADKRARNTILELVGGDTYGLHAVEITLANASLILEQMREAAVRHPAALTLSGSDLAWAAIRTAPETVVRQTGGTILTLPHIAARVPAHTLVLMQMRRSLRQDAAAGYEFASAHWSACPARRFVMGLFSAVGDAAIELRREGRSR